MVKIEKLLVGFHALKPPPPKPAPRYMWSSVLEVFAASGESGMYRRFDTQAELKAEYDNARKAAKGFEGIRVYRKCDAILVLRESDDELREMDMGA